MIGYIMLLSAQEGGTPMLTLSHEGKQVQVPPALFCYSHTPGLLHIKIVTQALNKNTIFLSHISGICKLVQFLGTNK